MKTIEIVPEDLLWQVKKIMPLKPGYDHMIAIRGTSIQTAEKLVTELGNQEFEIYEMNGSDMDWNGEFTWNDNVYGVWGSGREGTINIIMK